MQRGWDGKAKGWDKSDRCPPATIIRLRRRPIGKTAHFEDKRGYLNKYSIEESIKY
jgi:hypothetical protein